MSHYTYEQLAMVIALPITTILLIWITAIFHKNRKKWNAYDIPIVTLFILSIIRNVTILAYTLVLTFHKVSQETNGAPMGLILNLEYCSILIWVLNSIHTFQASNLTTLAVIGLFSVKLYKKQQSLKQFLTSTHIIYHLFCLTTLCACVGVAAILAKTNDTSPTFQNVTYFQTNPCKLMPFDLDTKYNVFILVLHVFLAFISLVAFIIICFHYQKIKKHNFDFLKKSNSDLSDLSYPFGNNNTIETEKTYYDNFTIQRNGLDHSGELPPQHPFYNMAVSGRNFYQQAHNRDIVWSSDMSATVSSTNSKRPCIAKKVEDFEVIRTGLETINPILVVCYLVYHLPLLILCIWPSLISPWPVTKVALWLGLIQDVLLPISLGIVDTRFGLWVSTVYKCTRKKSADKLPHGLDGKFRPFSSQPQSLEIGDLPIGRKSIQSVEHRFPITNGSLYTSIDGRLPVIHNYRRHKDVRGQKLVDNATSNQALNTSHLKRTNLNDHFNCHNCETDIAPSHSNLHHLSPHYLKNKINFLELQKTQEMCQLEINNYHTKKAEDQHQRNIGIIFNNNNNFVGRGRNALIKMSRERLSKSEDSLLEIQKEMIQVRESILKKKQRKIDYSSSEDDYLDQHFDSLSSKSSYSITTEANCDFHFFQSNDDPEPPSFHKPDLNLEHFNPKQEDNAKTYCIRRSNSRRSLENFQAFIEDRNDLIVPKINPFFVDKPTKIRRSNSYMTIEDRRKKSRPLMRSGSKLSDCTYDYRQKIKSVEYLPQTNSSTVLIESANYFDFYDPKKRFTHNFISSAPDLKKVFISEYL